MHGGAGLCTAGSEACKQPAGGRGGEDLPFPADTSPALTMKAISPVRSVRSCYEAVCCLSEQSLAIARGGPGKSPALEEPISLLYDMNGCYSKLRELVPGIPQGTKLSQVEILQHVIDYILDLQIVLEEQAKGQDPAADTALLSLKASELASELCSKDERRLCH
ncbi:inhibitor of DNA binding 3, HLH protein [Chelydra serpentina]|uniref:Inhibitor of DNA binding 3, HLH protein n=2 Tax=Chelydra serpentina TaxID=8475 RepID=A0A8T1SU35_CHESE|nr:inhibitor of DNA binding 3, HLH protein [Chelydra serpentina]